MNIILKKDAINQSEFEWFKEKLDDDFLIEDEGKSIVLFGFNGIGKTTIYRILRENLSDKTFFIDYEAGRDFVESKKKELVISTEISKRESLKIEKANLSSKIDIKNVLKTNTGISTKNQTKGFTDRIISAQSNSFMGFTHNQNDIDGASKTLNNIPFKVYFTCRELVNKVTEINKEIEFNSKHMLFKALNIVNELVDNSSNKCPICDSPHNDIKVIIEKKLEEYKNYKSELILKLKENSVDTSEENIKALCDFHMLMKNDKTLFEDMMLCDASPEKYKELDNLFKQIQKIDIELNDSLKLAQTNYDNVCKVKERLEDDLKKYFSIKKMICNPDQFSINITFPREIKSYSTGERNLICFLYNLYSFNGSDKELLILDDPVSSLDLINMYKIAFEICRNSKQKRTLVLTHSVELLNIFYSQEKSLFKYYYLDEFNGNIFVQNFITKSDNLIKLDALLPFDKLGIIACLKDREVSSDDNIILPLHFSDKEHFYQDDKSKFSNYKLIEMIDNFSDFEKNNFYENSYNKVIYLAALRVWLEKQLFELIPKENEKLKNDFIKLYTIGQKIELIFKQNNEVKKGSITISRSQIMSKKVMLNQAVHYYSQIMPFAYAINLSLDALKNEILEIKRIFGVIK